VAGAMALVTLGCIGMEEDRQKIVDFVMDMGENGVVFVMGVVKLDAMFVVAKVN
jgi:hypothetical protein